MGIGFWGGLKEGLQSLEVPADLDSVPLGVLEVPVLPLAVPAVQAVRDFATILMAVRCCCCCCRGSFAADNSADVMVEVVAREVLAVLEAPATVRYHSTSLPSPDFGNSAYFESWDS